MRVIANVVVGEPDTHPSKPSHTRGVREGNKRSWLRRESNRRRSTGINAKDREPILPQMPKLTPP